MAKTAECFYKEQSLPCILPGNQFYRRFLGMPTGSGTSGSQGDLLFGCDNSNELWETLSNFYCKKVRCLEFKHFQHYSEREEEVLELTA